MLGLRGYDFEREVPEIIVCEFGVRSNAYGYSFRDLAEFGESKGMDCIISHKRNGAMEVLWLGLYNSDYVRQLPETAWGDMIFVRRDVTDEFIKCLSSFSVSFPCQFG